MRKVRIYWGSGTVVVRVKDTLSDADLWAAAEALGGKPSKIEDADTDVEIAKP